MKKVVLLFEGRTGSSMLVDMLGRQPGIGFVGERVAHMRHEGWPAQEAWIDRLFSDPASVDHPSLASAGELRVVGFKVKLREIASPAGLRESLVRHDARVIHMTRRNLVKQVVSSIRATDLYESSGHYNLEPGQEDLLPGRYPIPPERFERTLRWLESHVDTLEGFVADLPLPVLPVSYEEVVASPGAAVDRICEWLDVPCGPVEPGSIELTPDDLSRVVSNFAELAERYRGTRYAAWFE